MTAEREPLLGETRKATISFAEALEHQVLEGDVQIDGPWVHVRNARKADSPRWRTPGGQPKWTPTEDVSYAAAMITEIRWHTPQLRGV